MALTILALKRAFTAKQHMALAAGNNAALGAIEPKDVSDCLHLGLTCEIIDVEDSGDIISTVEEFIANCRIILETLSNCASGKQIDILLASNKSISLTEESRHIRMKMDGKQIILCNLSIQKLYTNLLTDIQSYPDLYGQNLSNYARQLKRSEELLLSH